MPTRQQYNKAFLAEFAQLNAAQRTAVEHIEGPVLVIAGPGTGKTHILSARIGRILMETDTQPFNILCLTFTEAGVRAMRERLLQFIGPEAYRVHIFTFHSFCNNIIQDNPALFGAHGLEPISELEQIELLQSLLEELQPNHPLKQGRSNAYFYLAHLKSLFQLMKREYWSLPYVQSCLTEYVQAIPTMPEFIYQVNRGRFRKGDLKEAKIEDEKHRVVLLDAAVRLYPRYLEKMQQAKRYDYDDMIIWVLKAFQKHEGLLRRYQEQYLYFLIDEYQDTNGAQNSVLLQLLKYWQSPNIFIVGDDDQSIYEFQGARLKNVREFHDTYRNDLKVIMLLNNYRSSQQILNAAHHLIEKNEKRLLRDLQFQGLEKKLVAYHEVFKSLPQKPTLVQYPNRFQETIGVVEQIIQLQSNNFPLEEIAVLFAQHRQIQLMVNILEKRGIPYNVKQRVNILELPLVRNLNLLLEYITAEYKQPFSGESLLFPLLHADFLKLDPRDVATLAQYQAKINRETRPFWRHTIQNINSIAQANNLYFYELPSIQAFADFINLLIADYRNISVVRLFERVVNRSGLLKFVLDHEESVWLTQILSTLFQFIQEEAHRNPKLNLHDLLRTFKNMEDNRIRLEINKTIVAAHGVNLMTAHSAKGLEFEKVFMVDCVKDYWEPRQRAGNYQFTIPSTLTFSGEEDALEAKRRLFYVAMTRAKATLNISYSKEDDKSNPLQRTLFIDELFSAEPTVVEAIAEQLSSETIVKTQQLVLSINEKPQLEPLPKKELQLLLEDFRLSVSAMNTYLGCPLSFFYEHVLKVPTLTSEAATYGNAMHAALQRLYEVMLSKKNKAFSSENQFLRYFEEYMRQVQFQFTESEYKRRTSMGRISLSYHYEHFVKQSNKDVRVELLVRHTEVEGVPITGVIDKIEFSPGNKAHIIDYKTGKADETKLKRPDQHNVYGGSYYRQLVFYKLLYESYRPLGETVQSGEIIFLDPTPKGEYLQKQVVFNSKDVQAMKQLIRTTFEKIQAYDFFEGCNKHNCVWCNFVRQHQTMDTLANVEAEAMDD